MTIIVYRTARLFSYSLLIGGALLLSAADNASAEATATASKAYAASAALGAQEPVVRTQARLRHHGASVVRRDNGGCLSTRIERAYGGC